MSYLDEGYLGSNVQAPMALPQELIDRLAGDVQTLADDIPVPPTHVRLPGGIIIPKQTLWLIGMAVAIVVVWWWTKKKKKK